MEYTENGNSNQQKENGLLFGIGNPLLDILAKVAPGNEFITLNSA